MACIAIAPQCAPHCRYRLSMTVCAPAASTPTPLPRRLCARCAMVARLEWLLLPGDCEKFASFLGWRLAGPTCSLPLAPGCPAHALAGCALDHAGSCACASPRRPPAECSPHAL